MLVPAPPEPINVCPTTAAALTLALATDSDARALASHRSESGTDLIALPAGAYRLPDRVQPLLSAVALEHIGRHPAASPFAPTGKLRIGAPRLAHLIARGAALAGLPTPAAARPLSGHRPASPFAAAITGRASVTDH